MGNTVWDAIHSVNRVPTENMMKLLALLLIVGACSSHDIPENAPFAHDQYFSHQFLVPEVFPHRHAVFRSGFAPHPVAPPAYGFARAANIPVVAHFDAGVHKVNHVAVQPVPARVFRNLNVLESMPAATLPNSIVQNSAPAFRNVHVVEAAPTPVLRAAVVQNSAPAFRNVHVVEAAPTPVLRAPVVQNSAPVVQYFTKGYQRALEIDDSVEDSPFFRSGYVEEDSEEFEGRQSPFFRSYGYPSLHRYSIDSDEADD